MCQKSFEPNLLVTSFPEIATFPRIEGAGHGWQRRGTSTQTPGVRKSVVSDKSLIFRLIISARPPVQIAEGGLARPLRERLWCRAVLFHTTVPTRAFRIASRSGDRQGGRSAHVRCRVELDSK